MIRIFKREAEFEVWMLKEGRFELLATYPICRWSGKLGPKLREGDRQAPEGFYAIDTAQLRHIGRHPRAFNIGYPNALDRGHGHTGSYILVHGGCKSIGCFAMTDPLMDEVYALADQAIRQGQDHIQVQIFPFRMTDANLARHANSQWHDFWLNLKEGYDAFEATGVPPNIHVCNKRYVVAADHDQHAETHIAHDACRGEVPFITSTQPSRNARHAAVRTRIASSRLSRRASVSLAHTRAASHQPARTLAVAHRAH
jgi:murein L,D-transpeptidase YafK